MKRFYCDCGSQVFFDTRKCLGCNRFLGFDPQTMEMAALSDQSRLCNNGLEFGVCNWLLDEEDNHPLCRACQFNRTVPNQSLPGNRIRWHRLEEGKKRLFFTLMRLGLPLIDGWRDPKRGLLLDFIEDARSREQFPESFVSTGYLGGIITINALEADEVARITTKEELGEDYRTVLGHLRHESGHYYWQRLDPDQDLQGRFQEVFGDPARDYSAALALHYSEGAPDRWRDFYISAYASAHPVEDWAETWGHYLHIYDALETAAAHGVSKHWPEDMDIRQRIALWRDLSITLNELNRSVGRGDAYPFVINSMVEGKLEFVDDVICRLRGFR